MFNYQRGNVTIGEILFLLGIEIFSNSIGSAKTQRMETQSPDKTRYDITCYDAEGKIDRSALAPFAVEKNGFIYMFNRKSDAERPNMEKYSFNNTPAQGCLISETIPQ